MKSIYVLFIISVVSLIMNKSLAQSIFFDMEALNKIQSKYQLTQSIDNEYKDSLICVKAHNIPDSILLNSYPFDADSIFIAIPNLGRDTYDDVYYDFDKPGRYPIISKMTKEETAEFADNIYNYNFTGNHSIYYSSVEKDNPPRIEIYQYETTFRDMVIRTSLSRAKNFTLPNIILLFYHHNKINYIGIYFDDEESQIRMATSFMEPKKLYLGEYCPDRNLRLRNFFKSKYNLDIIEYENYDYGVPLLPLIENQNQN